MFSNKKSSSKPKKSQETQSPVTKLFKKMCRNSDSSSCCNETENLLKQKRKKKEPPVTCECNPPLRPAAEKKCSSSDNKTRDSNVGQPKMGSPPNRDDTFSCTSCALKRCVTSDPPKLVGLVCIALAFVLIAAFCNWLSCSLEIEDEECIVEKRDRRSDSDNDRKPWDASKSRLMSGLSELMGPGYKDSSMPDMSMDQFGDSGPELSSILDPVKVNEAYSSNSLRNFYKKLLKTDVQIKNLKKGFAALKRASSNDFFDSIPQRGKRSLKVSTGTTRADIATPSLNKRSLKNLKIYYPPENGVKAANVFKFDITEDGETETFPDLKFASDKLKAQKKKWRHQYSSTAPNNLIQATKYTPSLKDYKSASYQHEMKHPYNKNSEKLDELLNRLLDKEASDINRNIEEISNDDEVHTFRPTMKKTEPMKGAKEDSRGENTNEFQQATKQWNMLTKTKEDDKALNQLRDNNRYDKYKTTTPMKDDDSGANMDPPATDPNTPDVPGDGFEYMITLATVLGSPSNKYRKDPTDQRLHFPKLRRLLQHTKNYDEDDDDDNQEAEDYEDQTKEPWDREKRMAKPTEISENTPPSMSTTNTPTMKNLNWKGPLPLYHDELTNMIEAAIKMASDKSDKKLSKVKKPKNQKNNDEYGENDATDNYDNYDELVEMAQAYSDYGVLDGKKETVKKNEVPVEGSPIETWKRNQIWDQIKNKVDKPRQLLTQRINKSRGEIKADTDKFLKKLGLHKRFLTDKLLGAKRDNDFSTNPSALSDVAMDKSINYKNPAKTITDYEHHDNIQPHHKELENRKESRIYTGIGRSLKSIETDETYEDGTNSKVDPEFNNEEVYNLTTDGPLNITSNNTVLENKSEQINPDSFNATGHKLNAHKINIIPRSSNDSLNYNNSKPSFGLGDIFGMIADFCLFLAGFDTEQEKKDFSSVPEFIAVLNPSALLHNNKTTTTMKNDTRAPETAMFDKNMVENVGYRSRVLLSFEEGIQNVTSSDKYETSEPYEVTTTKRNDISLKNETENLVDDTNELISTKNVTVVKRSANSNLLTWNDLYDDEYGVKDKLDNDMKERSNDKYNEMLSKSENWLENKLKLIAYSVKNKKKLWKAGKNAARNKTKTVIKRSISKLKKDSGKETFEALTVNMKKVFHEAAAAIQDNSNREARSDSEQTSTLMQQLVALMSELVDLQVRQKTCVQLPDDLRSFLIWLTTPNPQERNDLNFDTETSYDAGPTTQNILNMETFELMSPNTRNDCLGTIHDVEDLIQQYDDMSEEDKSKMSGVREYLEHQLDFLHKQLADFNEFGFPVMYQEHSIRRRRQLQKDRDSRRRQRKVNRFIKYFGRRRTKSTLSDEDTTEDYRTIQRKNEAKNDKKKKNDKKVHGKVDSKNGHLALVDKNVVNDDEDVKVDNENMRKRNLQDVYYSPLGTTNATTVKYSRV